jgi:hypothetical protein
MQQIIKYSILIFLLLNIVACINSTPKNDNKIQINHSIDSTQHSVEIVQRIADSLIANSLVSSKLVVHYRKIIYFDSIRASYIESGENMLNKINMYSKDKNVTNDSMFFVNQRKYFNRILGFYNNFNGFFVSEYYYINKDSLLCRYLWIDNSLSLKSYSFDYYMSPVYRNDSIINYIDSNKYVILHKDLWEESFKVKK